jgi:hypothetical protein
MNKDASIAASANSKANRKYLQQKTKTALHCLSSDIFCHLPIPVILNGADGEVQKMRGSTDFGENMVINPFIAVPFRDLFKSQQEVNQKL